MNSNFSLYLASKSTTRRFLLEKSHIPYIIIEQAVDETLTDLSLPLEELVSILAVRKMDNVLLPPAVKGHTIFVLSADTLALDAHGVIQGKPTNYTDAQEKIRQIRGISTVSTAFCLDKKKATATGWETVERIVRAVSASCTFNVPDEWIDVYMRNSPALHATGGITIENFGMQFLERVDGSYSTILGLPLYEVRQALTDFGFFSR
jgi:septum formation protein